MDGFYDDKVLFREAAWALRRGGPFPLIGLIAIAGGASATSRLAGAGAAILAAADVYVGFEFLWLAFAIRFHSH